MKFGVLRFGEKCARHPDPKPRGMDSRGRLSEAPKVEAAEVARNRRTGDWADWRPRPASAQLDRIGVQQPAYAGAAQGTAGDLLVEPPKQPVSRAVDGPDSIRGSDPVYLASAPPAAPAPPPRFAGSPTPTLASSVRLPEPNAADLGYDPEAVVDALIARCREKALEKSNFNPNNEAQARAMQALLLKFGKGDGLTRANMLASIGFMGVTLRPHAADALWARLSPDGNEKVSFRDASKVLTGQSLPPRALPEVRVHLAAILEKLKTRYPPGEGVDALRRGFSVIDRDRSGSANKRELMRFLETLGLALTEHDGDVLMRAFDRNFDGQVSLEEFCRAVKGPMPAHRADLVKQAFAQLDTNSDGKLTVAELGKRFDSSKHPDVVAGRLKPEDVASQFMARWDTRLDGKRDNVVTLAEFLDYYDDASATIQDDVYFELMIRNAWHLSGGEGAAANTSNKRVLVTFKDKSQRVVEIKNDLGLRVDDPVAVRRRLEQQGVRDIAEIKLK